MLLFALAYQNVAEASYASVSSNMQGAVLLAHVLSGSIGDALLREGVSGGGHTAPVSLRDLVWVSSAGVVVAIVWGAWLMPPAPAAAGAACRQRGCGGGGGGLSVVPSHAPDVAISMAPLLLDHSLSHSTAAEQARPGGCHGAASRALRVAVCFEPMATCCFRVQWHSTAPTAAPQLGHTMSPTGGFRLHEVWQVAKAVYSDRGYLAVAIWWTCFGDPMFQNALNYESSLYDAFLPGAATDFNGTFQALSLLLATCAALLYRLPALHRGASRWPAAVTTGVSVVGGLFLLGVFWLHRSAAVPGAEPSSPAAALQQRSVLLPLLSLSAYYALHAFANAMYYDLTAKCVARCASLDSGGALSSPRFPSVPEAHPSQESTAMRRARGSDHGTALPPFFVIFVLNACVSVVVQSLSTLFVFQLAAASVPAGYALFGGVLAAGGIAIMLLSVCWAC